MNILVGIDLGRHYKAALSLASKLKFEKPKWIFAHSVDVSVAFSGYNVMTEAPFAFDFIRSANEAGQVILDEAKEQATACGIEAETALLAGTASSALADYSDDIGADLVCVHAGGKGRIDSLFLGSVSRGVAIASKSSVLVSKGTILPMGKISVVFATDHSDYANQAIDKFIGMHPNGIKHIHVVSALHLNQKDVQFDIGKLDTEIEKWLAKTAKKKTNEVVEKLSKAGFSCTGEVLNLPVNEAISHAMKDTGADLLVMGAQGHGFMHRLVLGSVSLHQVVAEPYSVLIVRP